MYKVGVFPGKFFPPHRGHLHAAINAATMCERLYVVVSDNMEIANRKCEECGIRPLPLKTRARWMAQELKGFDHIHVLILDETGIPPYPEGTQPWSLKLINTVPEKFHAIFGGEPEYQDTYMQNFQNVDYVLYDYTRTRYAVSGTAVRDNPLKHWDYILGAARRHFAKRILITGTESCGKSTLAKYLAKIYHTSWTVEEYGREFIEEELGGCGEAITREDFIRIAGVQRELEEQALRNANRVVFFDSDAVTTYYYGKMYLNEYIDELKMYIDPSRYDLTFFCSPNVPWVEDGQRFLNKNRVLNHRYMETMYRWVFGYDRIVNINDDSYKRRLEYCVGVVDGLIGDAR